VEATDHTFVFADLAGYTALTEAHGDGDAAQVAAGSAACRGGDYFGAAVNLAARVAGVARAGEIVCTEPVASVATRDGLASARPMGVVRLKNVACPVALFELSSGGPRAPLAHIDPVCRMQVGVADAAATVAIEGTSVYVCSDACAAAFRAAPEQYLGAQL
jgi:class 3 adenylate cyclase